MSHDIFFAAPDGVVFDSDAALLYFKSLPHYKSETNDDDGYLVFYEDPDTEVYWTCGFSKLFRDSESPIAREVPNAGAKDTGLSFSVNYVRPKYFGLEAMPFAARIARDLGLLVFDPQRDAQLVHPDAEAMIGSWVQGNDWASTSNAGSAKYLERDAAFAMWHYNSNVSQAQAAFNSAEITAFVPHIFPLTKRGSDRVLRAVVWPAGCPIAIPPCEVLSFMVERKPTLVERLTRKKSFDVQIGSLSDVQSVMGAALVTRSVLGMDFLMEFAQSTTDIGKLMKSMPIESVKLFEKVNYGMFVDTPRPAANAPS